MTRGPGKEYGTNKPPPTERVQQRSKGDTMCPSTSQNPSHWHPSWLNKACTTRKDSESEWLSKDNAETNPITIRPQTASHMAEQFSWVPLPCCSLLRCLLPIKSLALSACVSSDNSFLSVRQEPALGALEGPPTPPTTPGGGSHHQSDCTCAHLEGSEVIWRRLPLLAFTSLCVLGGVWGQLSGVTPISPATT